jgi:hypothetical protein
MRTFTRSLLSVSLIAIVSAAAPAAAQEMAAEDVISRSIAFHDPDGLWSSGSFRLNLVQTLPIMGTRTTDLVIDNGAGKFWMKMERFGRVTETTVTGDECWTTFNGSTEFTEQEAERFQLSCERMLRWRDYYTYLYGLPMKLRDEGTIIDPEAVRTEFEGDDVWQVRVTYDPEVGTDTWYFYFDPSDYALVGYRFYHDESANDGEYIILDRLEEGDMRLPKVRSWFRNNDDELLGTDKLMEMERISRDR